MSRPVATSEVSRDRFWTRVDLSGECWLWTGYVNPKGYGKVDLRQYGEQLAHRASLRLFGIELPDGVSVHHRCHNPACVRPEHLEVIEAGLHNRLHKTRNGTHCLRGHEFTEENTYVRKNGTRWCLACSYERRKVA
jgi:hypothetical protein